MTNTPGPGYGTGGDPGQPPSGSDPAQQPPAPQSGQPSYGGQPGYGAQSYGSAPEAPQGGQPGYGAQSYGSAPQSYDSASGSSNAGAGYGDPSGYSDPNAGGYGDPYVQSHGATGGDPYGQQQPPYGSPGAVAQAQSGLIEVPGLGVVKVATFADRLVARLIDGALMFAVMFIVALVSGVFSSVAASSGDAAIAGFSTGGVVLLWFVAVVFGIAYEVTMTAIYGATLGKMAMGVKVVDQRNGQSSWGVSFLRWLIIKAGDLVCGLSWLVMLSAVFDNSGRMQGWHDKVANDIVIKTK